MPTTQQWIEWAKGRAVDQMGSGIAHSNRFAYVEYCGGITRFLRDAAPPPGGSGTWSRVNELGNADHYWFSRGVIFTAACYGYAPIGAGSAHRSPVLERVLPIIRGLGDPGVAPVEGHRRGGSHHRGRGRAGSDRSRTTAFDWIADRIEDADSLVRTAGDAVAATTAVVASGGVAVLWSLLIPMWDALKEVSWVAHRPGLVPGTGLFDGEPSSEPGREQMLWGYAGISDAINDDFAYCWQWLSAASLEDLDAQHASLDELLPTLPPGASPSSEGWG